LALSCTTPPSLACYGCSSLPGIFARRCPRLRPYLRTGTLPPKHALKPPFS
ncbi:hypothetical protein M9458_024799, partial [Cirrhinus mrigala]